MIFLQSALANNGQVQAVTSGTVTSFNGAQAYVGSNPLVSTDATAATDSFVGGFRYKSDGALRIYEGVGDFVREGIAVTAQGQLCVAIDDVDADDAVYFGGCALTNDGRVYMSTGSAPSYTGPLDIYSTGVAAAYSSARALSSAMLGQNGYTLTATDATDLAFAYNASTGEIDSAAITTWKNAHGGDAYGKVINDHSGNTVNLAPSSDLQRGKWIANGQGSKAAFTDQGGGGIISYLSALDAVINGGQATLFMVAKSPVSCGLTGEDDYLFLKGGSEAYIDFLAGANNAGGDYPGLISDASYKLIDVTVEFGNNSYIVDGTELTENNDYDSGTTLGNISEPASLDGASDETGAIQEVIIYAGILSAPNRLAIRQNISTYYGITLP